MRGGGKTMVARGWEERWQNDTGQTDEEQDTWRILLRLDR